MSETILHVRGLHKTYVLGKVQRRVVNAVRGVSLEIRRGMIFGFLGPNGSGKTTTIRCVLGLSRPSQGEIIRFGRSDFDPVDFFSKTAYCPEESHYPQYLTGREILNHWAGMFGLTKDVMGPRVEQALESVGLLENADRRLSTYSKGMKQRIGIGGTLLSDPELVILDEPARGLDPLARHLVRNLIVDLAKQGKTVFMNSHILSEVERICTDVAIIHKGKVRRHVKVSDLEAKEGLIVRYTPNSDGGPRPEGVRELDQGFLEVEVQDTAQLTTLVGDLAGAGARVQSVERKRVNLEDYFISVVEQGSAEDAAQGTVDTGKEQS